MSPKQPTDVPHFEVLNFFYDNESNCALTALIDNVLFHVIADTGEVKHGSVGQQYAKLLQAIKEANIEDEESIGTDSGVDVKEEESKTEDAAEEALQRWMLEPLTTEIAEKVKEGKAEGDVTLEQWYTLPTYFYNLQAKDRKLQAIELEPNDDLTGRMSNLLPEITIPKYIRELDVPWYKAEDLLVIGGSASPAPYRPSRVQVQEHKKTYFLKLVDPEQPQPTKRELQLLKKIQDKGLHEKIQCPKLEGIVTLDNDRTKMIGFLQTDIADPTPLTHKLDAEVPQHLRDRWAGESERTIQVLHESGIVWGDAKADNFMVDADDKLWIIDFGGSYTEGWIDPEMKETDEGDDMGVLKIANALHDPVANTWDPDTEKSFGGSSPVEASSSRKRKASEESEAEDDGEVDAKRQRTQQTADEATYCYCGGPSSGRMVGCDGEECEKQWFHFDCIGIDEAPKDQWYCKDCKAGS